MTVVAPRTPSSSETERLEEPLPSRRLGLKLAVAGGAGLVILVGGLFLRHACRSGERAPEQLTAVSATKVVPVVVAPPPLPAPMDAGTEAAPPTAEAASPPAVDLEAQLTAAEAAHAAEERSGEGRPAKRREKPAVGRFLRTANAFFDRGKSVDAVRWAARALVAGGGLRAHLALGRYHHSLRHHREALFHYRAALNLDPDNKLAALGVEVLEKLQATGR
jgi:hypothetical protein